MGAMITTVDNYIDGRAVPPVAASAASYLDVRNPATSAVVGRVALSGIADVEAAVAAAAAAFPAWSAKTTKARAAVLLCFHGLVREHAEELARLVVLENGKNLTEARADVAKGNETVEYAASLPCLSGGSIDEVSGGVTCRDRRDPLGVVASIVPFNFPVGVCPWATTRIYLVASSKLCLHDTNAPVHGPALDVADRPRGGEHDRAQAQREGPPDDVAGGPAAGGGGGAARGGQPGQRYALRLPTEARPSERPATRSFRRPPFDLRPRATRAHTPQAGGRSRRRSRITPTSGP